MRNANGVLQKKPELAQFLNDNVDSHHKQVLGYQFYSTNHPDGKAHAGTGILRLALNTTFLTHSKNIIFAVHLNKSPVCNLVSHPVSPLRFPIFMENLFGIL